MKSTLLKHVLTLFLILGGLANVAKAEGTILTGEEKTRFIEAMTLGLQHYVFADAESPSRYCGYDVSESFKKFTSVHQSEISFKKTQEGYTFKVILLLDKAKSPTEVLENAESSTKLSILVASDGIEILTSNLEIAQRKLVNSGTLLEPIFESRLVSVMNNPCRAHERK